MARVHSSLFIFLSLLLSASLSLAAAPVPSDPIHIKTANGWKGLYAVEDEYAEYSFTGGEVKLQDAHHILLKPSLGLMVTFADKTQLGAGTDLLGDHLQWELDYWRKHANKVESVPRNDLSGARDDLRITEIRLYNGQGGRLNVYLIALASKSGVFAMSISPADGSIDAVVKEIAGSFKLVQRRLDPDEVKRVSLEERSSSKVRQPTPFTNGLAPQRNLLSPREPA
jgi:hypothetical protein